MHLPDPYAEQEFCSELTDWWFSPLATVSACTLWGVYCFPQNSWGTFGVWRVDCKSEFPSILTGRCLHSKVLGE
jgi:hypothetical protein